MGGGTGTGGNEVKGEFLIRNRIPSEAAMEGLAGIALRENAPQEIVQAISQPMPVGDVKLSGGVTRAKAKNKSSGRILPD